MRTRTIVAVGILAGLTFAPRCATRSGYEAASPASVVPNESPQAPVVSNENPQAPVVPSEARDPSLVEGEMSTGSTPRNDKETSAPRNDKGDASAVRNASAPSDPFRKTIQPILSARCGQCHDPGGRMYDRLPFDDPQVVSSHSAGILRRLKGEDRAAVEKWVAGLAAATDPR
jgi:hypothetical protein